MNDGNAYLIGTDEAGYGPNLGPLVIGASAWRVSPGTPPAALYELLAEAISAEPAPPPRLQIADSKALYAAGLSLLALELPVLACLRWLGREPASWRAIWPALRAFAKPEEEQTVLEGEPWHEAYEEPLPTAAEGAVIARAAEHLAATARASAAHGREAALIDLQAAALFPQQFNAACRTLGNKATVLSLTTLGLVRRLLAALPPGPATVVCDKHGGRDRYAGLLQQTLADGLVQTLAESRSESRYELSCAGRRVQLQFVMQGERLAPPALASLVAKYLRELALRAFNRFWRERLPGLRPTAGYPADAARFVREIEPARAARGIARTQFWRER